MVIEIILSILVFLALYLGLGIGYLSKLDVNSKYLVILQKVIFLFIIQYLFYLTNAVIVGIFFTIFFAIILFTWKKINQWALFTALAVLFFTGLVSKDSLIIGLVFLYAMILGSLESENTCKDAMRFIARKYYLFFVIVFALIIFQQFL